MKCTMFKFLKFFLSSFFFKTPNDNLFSYYTFCIAFAKVNCISVICLSLSGVQTYLNIIIKNKNRQQFVRLLLALNYVLLFLKHIYFAQEGIMWSQYEKLFLSYILFSSWFFFLFLKTISFRMNYLDFVFILFYP